MQAFRKIISVKVPFSFIHFADAFACQIDCLLFVRNKMRAVLIHRDRCAQKTRSTSETERRGRYRNRQTTETDRPGMSEH